jgi:flagellar hook-associated protein 2
MLRILLQNVADKINGDTNISKSVVATVIKDSSGKEQLMIRSRETGLDSKFEVSLGSGVDANGDLQALVLDTGNLVTLAGTGGITTTQAAKNAEMELNGVKLESNTNTFAETIPGLSISVSAVGTSLLTIAPDKDAVQASIQKFVDAYNAVNDLLSQSTKSVRTADGKTDDAAIKDGSGLLQGDSSTVSLQNSLRMMLQRVSSNATGAYTRLSEVGMQMQQGGKLTVDTER